MFSRKCRNPKFNNENKVDYCDTKYNAINYLAIFQLKYIALYTLLSLAPFENINYYKRHIKDYNKYF